MKLMRLALTGSLLLILAACGNDSPVNPPTNPNPPTDPGTPANPPGGIPGLPGGGVPTNPSPAPPTDDIPYYGEWAWSWQQSGGNEFFDEGRFSIVQVIPNISNTGFGFYQECNQGVCYDQIDGGVLLGINDENQLTVLMYRLDSANDAVLTYQAIDDDGTLTADEQGRPVFEGPGQSLDNVTNGPLNGTFKIILTDLPTTFPPVTPSSQDSSSKLQLEQALKAFR